MVDGFIQDCSALWGNPWKNNPIERQLQKGFLFMATKLAYQSSKWEKELRNKEKVWKQLNGQMAAQNNLTALIKRNETKDSSQRDYCRICTLGIKLLQGTFIFGINRIPIVLIIAICLECQAFFHIFLILQKCNAIVILQSSKTQSKILHSPYFNSMQLINRSLPAFRR